MAVDLVCYVSNTLSDVEEMLENLSGQHKEIFPKKFLISSAGKADSFHKEIALEYGLNSQSVFLVSLNDKSAACLVLDIAKMLKKSFGEENIIVLHGNETLI
jgi:hypothetical protein